MDAAPVLEGLIAQSRPAHGTLATPIRAAAAFVGASPGGDASGAGSSNSGSGGGGGVTLIVRAVTDEQAQVSCADCQAKKGLLLPARRMPPARSCDCLVPTGFEVRLPPFCLPPARCHTLRAYQSEDPTRLSPPQVLVESAQGREELQRCDVAAFLFDAQQPGAIVWCAGWLALVIARVAAQCLLPLCALCACALSLAAHLPLCQVLLRQCQAVLRHQE